MQSHIVVILMERDHSVSLIVWFLHSFALQFMTIFFAIRNYFGVAKKCTFAAKAECMLEAAQYLIRSHELASPSSGRAAASPPLSMAMFFRETPDPDRDQKRSICVRY